MLKTNVLALLFIFSSGLVQAVNEKLSPRVKIIAAALAAQDFQRVFTLKASPDEIKAACDSLDEHPQLYYKSTHKIGSIAEGFGYELQARPSKNPSYRQQAMTPSYFSQHPVEEGAAPNTSNLARSLQSVITYRRLS